MDIFQVGVRRAYGLPYAAMSFAAFSLYPPGVLYTSPPQPPGGRVRVTEMHDFNAEMRSPVWPGSGAHFPAVPPDESTLLVVALTALVLGGPLAITTWQLVDDFDRAELTSRLEQVATRLEGPGSAVDIAGLELAVPTGGRLTLEHCRLLGVWAGDKHDEDRLQEQFNEGTRHRDGKHHDEFYPWGEWPKILRDLETNYARLPEPTNIPTSTHRHKRKRCEGCGGGKFFCHHCKCSVGDWPRHMATKKHRSSISSSPPPT